MNAIERLIEIEEIRALMARRVRSLDEKDWDAFADCYADDAESHSHGAPGTEAARIVGGRAIADAVGKALVGVTSVHQVHSPEIELTGPDSATGVWALNDILSWEEGGRRRWLRGYGHYRQTYSKASGGWRIVDHHLTRLLMERGSDAADGDGRDDYGGVGPGSGRQADKEEERA